MSSIATSVHEEIEGSTKDVLLDGEEAELSERKMLESKQEAFVVSEDYIAAEEEKCSPSFESNPKTLNDILHEFIPQMKISFEKWGETFRECDAIESLYPRRLDEMLKEAHCLEQQLKLQKDTLRNRLKSLTQALASNPQKDE